jgi:hypothetical protein
MPLQKLWRVPITGGRWGLTGLLLEPSLGPGSPLWCITTGKGYTSPLVNSVFSGVSLRMVAMLVVLSHSNGPVGFGGPHSCSAESCGCQCPARMVLIRGRNDCRARGRWRGVHPGACAAVAGGKPTYDALCSCYSTRHRHRHSTNAIAGVGNA